MAFSKLILFAVAVAFTAALPNFIEKMQILTEERIEIEQGQVHDLELFKYIRNNFKLSNDGSIPLLGTFKWQDCGSSSELIHISDLSLTPDPLKIPGKVGIKFDVVFKASMDAPLKAELKLEKHEGPIWLEIPCIDGIGSCTYDDLCEKLASATCPQAFDDHHIPCKCPFPQGNYSLPASTFPVDVGSIPNGDYYIKAELSYQSKQAICIEMYFSIA